MVKQHSSTAFRKAFQALVILAFIAGLFPVVTPVEAQTTYRYKKFLPVTVNGSASSMPLMTGISPDGKGDSSVAVTVSTEMKPLDAWLTGVTGGRSTSIYGTFMDLNPPIAEIKWYVEQPLLDMWNGGYTPFVNLPALSGDSAYTVATSSRYDTLITNWARSFKNFASNGARFAYIAPLQEMNGYWVNYGGDPTYYKQAYRRFQTIFAREGVPAQSVKWVFAPNAWTQNGMPLFEEYYPGNSYVDVVAISAYNFGYCKSGGVWQEPETVFNDPSFTEGHYLDRMRALAPSKPIFIAQTATSSYRSPGVSNPAEKDRWLRDAYAYLSRQPNVRAIIYFNIWNSWEANCDWKIFDNGSGSAGYKSGVNNNGYRYVSPDTLKTTDHMMR